MGAKEKALALHDRGFNCAQSVLGALAGYTDLEETALLAAAGGSAGVALGMLEFRHKTKHRTFTLGVPAILLAQAALAVWLAANL